jgi:uncharacterized protein YbdZ (MbtH family)
MEQDDNQLYKVVVNHEEQYSIWPADRENPLGWKEAGKQGKKAECLEYIKTIWTDMRPLSLRKRMEEMAQNPPQEDPANASEDDTPPLVDRLSQGNHPLEIVIRPARTLHALKECLDRNYVHVKFTETRGGTELGIRLDKGAKLPGDGENGTGPLHLEGTVTLDFVPVRCVADIDLQSMTGKGYLVKQTVVTR